MLLTLAVMLDGETSGTLTQKAVADVARISERTVRRTLSILHRAGDISIDSAHGRATVVALNMTVGNRTHGPVQPDTVTGSTGQHDRFNRSHDPVQQDTRSGLMGQDGGVTVSPKYIPPYSPPKAVETAGQEDGDDGLASRVPDHFAQRREPTPSTPSAEVDPGRWADLEASLAGRTTDSRGRTFGTGLTDVERHRVRGWVDAHGIDTIERLIASMPDRVGKPTAYLAKCIESHVEAQQEAQRERARVRRDGLYVPKPALRPEEISDFDVLGALGLKGEAS